MTENPVFQDYVFALVSITRLGVELFIMWWVVRGIQWLKDKRQAKKINLLEENKSTGD